MIAVTAMRTEGLVLELCDNKATVAVCRRSACHGCGATCAQCRKNETVCFEVEDVADFTVGESVWIESSTKSAVLMYALIFVLPALLSVTVCCAFNKILNATALFFTAFAVAFFSFFALYIVVGKRFAEGSVYKMVKKY